MRGSPPLHLAVLLLAFGLLAVPLIQLTGVSPQTTYASEPTEAPKDKPQPVRVVLRYTHQPESLRLMVDDKDLLAGIDWKVSPVEVDTEMIIGSDGQEFTLEAKWKDDQPDTAVSVDVELDGEQKQSETRWSELGEISDVLTYVWK